MNRCTFLGFLMLALATGGARAVDLPSEGQVVLVSSGGVVAGTGMLEGGDLELELLAGFVGFGTMTVIGEAEDVFVYDVMVQAGGAIVLTETLDDLAALVRGAGGTVEVSLREGGTANGGEAVGAAGAAGQEDDEDTAGPIDEVPRHADDVTATGEDRVDRASDEVGDVDAGGRAGGGIGDATDDVTGAGDGGGEVAGESDDGSISVGVGTDTDPSEPADGPDPQDEEESRGMEGVTTPEVPGLP